MKYLRLVRLKQWVKNLFLFIPLFFAGDIFNIPKLIDLSIGFLAFSLVASAIYIINDYRDIEADKLHPEKSKRPLPAGEIGKGVALVLSFLLLIAGFSVAYYLNVNFLYLLIIYWLINLGYSLGLKHISILDIFLVASGFLLRTIAGGIIAEVHISQWLVIMVFLLAVFLALAKRRDDIVLSIESGKVLRKASQHYNIDFANAGLTLLTAIIIVSYIMYSISEDVTRRMNSEYVYGTAIFVMAGLLRYMQIAIVERKSGSPTSILYKDRFVQFTIIGFILTFYFILYYT